MICFTEGSSLSSLMCYSQSTWWVRYGTFNPLFCKWAWPMMLHVSHVMVQETCKILPFHNSMMWCISTSSKWCICIVLTAATTFVRVAIRVLAHFSRVLASPYVSGWYSKTSLVHFSTIGTGILLLLRVPWHRPELMQLDSSFYQTVIASSSEFVFLLGFPVPPKKEKESVTTRSKPNTAGFGNTVYADIFGGHTKTATWAKTWNRSTKQLLLHCSNMFSTLFQLCRIVS